MKLIARQFLVQKTGSARVSCSRIRGPTKQLTAKRIIALIDIHTVSNHTMSIMALSEDIYSPILAKVNCWLTYLSAA